MFLQEHCPYSNEELIYYYFTNEDEINEEDGEEENFEQYHNLTLEIDSNPGRFIGGGACYKYHCRKMNGKYVRPEKCPALIRLQRWFGKYI